MKSKAHIEKDHGDVMLFSSWVGVNYKHACF